MEGQGILRPPNASTLTDAIVRSVIAAPSSSTLEGLPSPDEAGGSSISRSPRIRLTGIRAPVRFAPASLTPATPTNGISPLRAPAEAFLAAQELLSTARSNSTGLPGQDKLTREKEAKASRIELRRQRGRHHQEQYRKRQRMTLQELELCIQALHGHINKLQLQREITSLYASMCSTVWSVTAEYYRLFRFGRTDSVLMSEGRYSGFDPQAQEGFVRTAVAPDVDYGTVQGVDALLENWRYLSLGFNGMEIQLDRLENGAAEGSVVATSTTIFSITENTLRVVFPHLLGDQESGKLHPIGAKLLGQQVNVKAMTEFNWDDERGCMASIHMTPDLLTPLLRILGSLEDVAYVFNQARMTSECKTLS